VAVRSVESTASVDTAYGEPSLPTPSQLLFLPGASGSTGFWEPLANRLNSGAARVLVGYPGFGAEPAAPDVRNFDDLVRRVVAQLDRPTALVAVDGRRDRDSCGAGEAGSR